MVRNDFSNLIILWTVLVGDFILLNVVTFLFCQESEVLAGWNSAQSRMFLLISNFALLLSEIKYHTMIHERLVSSGEIVKKVLKLMTLQVLITYVLTKHVMFDTHLGMTLLETGTASFTVLLLSHLLARKIIKLLRQLGRNTRTVVIVGDDMELHRVHQQLLMDPTTGYFVKGYYADEEIKDKAIPWLGTVKGLVDDIRSGKEVDFGDEMYVGLSRTERDTIKLLSLQCDRQMTKFNYVPISVESISPNLRRRFFRDIEIFTTHDCPLRRPVNALVKRLFDVLLSFAALVLMGLLLPIIYLITKRQSPGPIFFKQVRTGLDGKDFVCYKFRSMHVNDNSDVLQATEDDPRKFPFGDFLRRSNIDELPQFWNVLRGDMSVVGPRPHMLAHTKRYSELIDKYMVRHFVKPGITGLAQVTGYRGETRELWQMEGRVRRDIWYMEHWNFWWDMRIIWLTFKMVFVHDKNAY